MSKKKVEEKISSHQECKIIYSILLFHYEEKYLPIRK